MRDVGVRMTMAVTLTFAGCTCGSEEAVAPPASATASAPPSVVLAPTSTTADSVDEHTDDTMDGVPVRLRDGGLFVATVDRARLESAMQVGLASFDDFSGAYAERDTTTVTALAEHPSGSDRPVIAYAVASGGDPTSTMNLVLALPDEGGWFLVLAFEGGTSSSDGDDFSNTVSAATFSSLGPYLRFDASGHLHDDSSEPVAAPEDHPEAICRASSRDDHDFTSTAICRIDPSPRCFVMQDASVSAHDAATAVSCFGDDGEAIEGVAETRAVEHVPAASTAFTIGPATGGPGSEIITVVRTPPRGDAPALQPRTLESLGTGANPLGLTDREHASMLAAGGAEPSSDDVNDPVDVAGPGALSPEAREVLEQAPLPH